MENSPSAEKPIPIPEADFSSALQKINGDECFYSIALFDILGFSNYVEKHGYQDILRLYEKLVELVRRQASSPNGDVSIAGSVVPAPISADWKNNALVAHANGYIQVGHFSDTFILFVNYELLAPSFWLRDSYYEPMPLLALEQGTMFYGPFRQYHHIYLSFLQTCMDFFCQSVLTGIPLRGVVSSGLARLDPLQSIFFGAPLVEAGKGEPAQDALGVAFGRSFSNYHPIYSSYYVPYTKHLKSADRDRGNGRRYLSHFVLDWPRYWREHYSSQSAQDAIKKMDLEPNTSFYYQNALQFFQFSKQHENWPESIAFDGTGDIRSFFQKADEWLNAVN